MAGLFKPHFRYRTLNIALFLLGAIIVVAYIIIAPPLGKRGH